MRRNHRIVVAVVGAFVISGSRALDLVGPGGGCQGTGRRN